MNYSHLLTSPTFFQFLLEIDLVIAEETKQGGCFFCGGSLHTSNWLRVGFGIPQGCGKEVFVRHSFTCGDCKKRCTPNSLRFMYYRWYASSVELVVSALRPAGDWEAQKKLRQALKISDETLAMFRRWWANRFFRSTFERRSPRAVAPTPGVGAPSLILSHLEKPPWTAKSALLAAVRFLALYRTDRLWAVFVSRKIKLGRSIACPQSPFSEGASG